MFQDLKTILPKSVKRAGIGDKVEEKQALKMFGEALNGFLSDGSDAQVKILYIKEGVISLACLSDETVEKIKANQKEIIDIINKNIGKDFIRQVRYLTPYK